MSGTDIHELAETILEAKRKYYSGSPIMSDAKYDALEERLRGIDPMHPVLSFIGSHTEATAKKAEHKRIMLSLDKTYVVDDLYSWQHGRDIVGTLKVDGASLSLIYKGGKLVSARTRGNGKIGEDVTDKIVWVEQLGRDVFYKKPTKNKFISALQDIGEFEVRGELFCSEEKFIRLSHEMQSFGLEQPTSPRNIVAGLLGRKTYHELTRYFQFFAFEILSDESIFQEEMQVFSVLEQLGFALPSPKLLTTHAEIDKYLEFVRGFMDEGEIGVDGAVFSYNELKWRDELGVTSHHPRYKLSFKWQGVTAESDITAIHWETSRLGIVTPVAKIEPVFLSGAKITNITLHNAGHVQTFDLKVGDRIELVRSGEVIPKFLRVVAAKKGSHFEWPKKCSACDATLIFDEVRLRCPNRQACPAQATGRIINWIRAVDIEDFSEKRLEPLMAAGKVRTVDDLYRLSVEDFYTIPMVKEKMANKLYEHVQKSKNCTMVQFLCGLGIEGSGASTWEDILHFFPDLDALSNATVEKIIEIQGFAEKSAEQIVQGLKESQTLIKKLLQVGVNPRLSDAGRTQGGALSGKVLVITGTLSRPRHLIEQDIKAAGGKLADSVSKNTFALVTEDQESTSSKFRKAKELAIPIWSEKKLHDFLSENAKK